MGLLILTIYQYCYLGASVIVISVSLGGPRDPRAEYGNIYCNILLGANIDCFEAYRCVGVVLWVEIRKKYRWCCVGGPKLLRDILY